MKFLRNKRRKTATRQQDPPSDAETIQYAEPYINTFTRRDSIYRKKAKKNVLRTIARARKSKERKPAEESARLEREALQFLTENPLTASKAFSKSDDIYQRNAKKMHSKQ